MSGARTLVGRIGNERENRESLLKSCLSITGLLIVFRGDLVVKCLLLTFLIALLSYISFTLIYNENNYSHGR